MELRAHSLEAGYARGAVLRGIDLSLRGGEVIAVVGANGCGKSTLLRCLARLQKPSAGRVSIGGDDVQTLGSLELARRIGYLPQQATAPAGLRVRELVRFGRHPHRRLGQRWSDIDENAVNEALRITDLLAQSEQALERLSGGQQQRAWLALVLAQQTPLLLLDEPVSMLDPGHQLDLLQRVRALATAGRGVVMVLHDLSIAARYADRLVALDGGRIVADGPPREVLTPQLVRQLYGIDVHLLSAPDDGAPIVVPYAITERAA